MIDVRPVIYVNGILLLVLAVAMGVPALVDAVDGDPDWRVFIGSAVATGFIGFGMALGARPERHVPLDPRQAFILTGTAWLLAAGFAALPFVFSELELSLADGVFEATSGITTTGSTVITSLAEAPRGILLWRALLNWLGGIGIIVMAVAILPILRIGGMQMFKMESSDKSEKVRPRVAPVAGTIAGVYASFTFFTALLLWLAGMAPFDAVCHAFSALSTGGFSTSDQSLAHWGAAAQWIVALAMLLGGASFPLFIAPWKHRQWPFLADSQMRWYFRFVVVFALVMTFWAWAMGDMEVGEAFRHGSFNVISAVTGTGFVSADYNAWGGFAQVVFFILLFIGGCTGSTSGAVKIFRWEVLFAMAAVHLKRLLYPHGVFVINFNRQTISEAVVDSVLGFVVMYFLTFALFALVLTMTGLDLTSALSGSAAALANAAHGLGEVIGPSGTYKPLPDAAKWVLAAEMLLGRLELFSVLVLCTRSFWRG